MDQRNNQAGDLNQFLYGQCYDQLCAAVSVALGHPVSAVLHQNQRRVEVDEEAVYYTFDAWVEYSEDESEEVWITCKISFNGSGFTFSLADIHRKDSTPDRPRPPRHLLADQHLILRLHMDDLREAEAERFLNRYCPAALATPMPVPIRSIMEEQMGLTVVTDIQLPGDAYGQTVFEDNDELVMDEDGYIMILPCRRGTVLIDGEKAFLNGIGAMRFTLAHEAYHWFAHRPYVGLHRLIGKQDSNSYNGTSRYSASDILEIQANTMASRILMPRESFINKFREMAGDDIHATISALASFFRVSYIAATVRLSQLGLHKYTQPTQTTSVTVADASDRGVNDYSPERYRPIEFDSFLMQSSKGLLSEKASVQVAIHQAKNGERRYGREIQKKALLYSRPFLL